MSVRVKQEGHSIELMNDHVKAVIDVRGVSQQFYAKGAEGNWEIVVSALRPPFPRPPQTMPLFAADPEGDPYRIVATEAFDRADVSGQSASSATITLTGTAPGCQLTQTITLESGSRSFHFDVAGELTGPNPKIEYLLAPFCFHGGTKPEFIHTPCLKAEAEDVIADRVFASPAVMLQRGGLFAALVPDVDAINDNVVYAAGARSVSHRRAFEVPEDPQTVSMPTALDLELQSGMTELPVFSYGFVDYVVIPHVYWRHPNKGAEMVRKLSSPRLVFGFDLFVQADAPSCRGYQQVSRFLWRRYGSKYAGRPRPQAMPFDEYAKVCYPAGFRYKGMHHDTHEAWQQFELEGKPAGGVRSTAPQWYHDLGFTVWWNNMRDAVGMYLWGKRGDPSLVEKARRVVELALSAPQEEGLFPSVYRFTERAWVGSYWRPPMEYDPERVDRYMDFDAGHYQTAAASKTVVHLLRYRRLCEDDPRILPFARAYADFIVQHVDSNGCLPAWFTHELEPVSVLRHNAEGGIHIWALCEVYAATGDAQYLETAKRMAGFLLQEILPTQHWIDFEAYFSCAVKPLSHFDKHTGQGPRNTLCMLWAAEGLLSLYLHTNDRQYLDAAEAALDYAVLYQSVWHPHFIPTAYTFGGFAVQNTDAEWLDARQSEFAVALMRMGLATRRQDLLERAVAAARASMVLIHHERHVQNDIYPYPSFELGLGPENIDHEGYPQSPMRTGSGWGEGSGLSAVAELLHDLGGVYVDVARNLAVGIDGVYVRKWSCEGRRLYLELENHLAVLRVPWERPHTVEMSMVGLEPGEYELHVGGEMTEITSDGSEVRVCVTLKPDR